MVNHFAGFGHIRMNIPENTISIFATLALIAGLFCASCSSASNDSTADAATVPPEESGELYLPSDDAVANVARVLETARENNKLALVVMGANWCHDSRALASRINKEPLKTLIDGQYETIFVDVGYLDKGKTVISSLGPPVYYATPTVLIVDPVSGRLVNEQNRHLWADAYSISMEDSLEYFQQMADTDLTDLRDEIRTDLELDGELQALLENIDAFELVQADRLYDAYAVLGPMLKAYKEGNEEAFSDNYWNQVSDFRYKVAQDVDELRNEANARAAAGEHGIILLYPEYPAFSWETEGQ